VREILLDRGRASGVLLDSGERLDADFVLFTGDAAALADGLLGRPVQKALGLPTVAPERRSLSAITWHGAAEVEGFDLSHHNVFFCDPAGQGYVHEFEALARGQLAEAPSVYLCAQDRRADSPSSGHPAVERVMIIVNAPPAGDHRPAAAEELQRCQDQMLAQMARAGLRLKWGPEGLLRTTPQDFAQLFPATGGALYGRASQGWRATFARPGSATPVPGLFLAGGSVHPGPGAPMASLSGQLAAERICADLRSTRRWMPAPTPGGISMR
jgi:1-hydroxycarotenoid 3,4-desaturase